MNDLPTIESMGKANHKGSWSLESKSDPRWNKKGRGKVGAFEMPKNAKRAVEKLTAKYGNPPSDLEWGYWKD